MKKSKDELDYAAFLEAWDNCSPSQDNEYRLTDRGSFKAGWYAAKKYYENLVTPLQVSQVACVYCGDTGLKINNVLRNREPCYCRHISSAMD